MSHASGGDSRSGHSPDDLDAMTYVALKELCKKEGLKYTGFKKAELVDKLEKHFEAVASAPPPAADDEYDDADGIKAQLHEMSIEEIVDILDGRGEDTSGGHDALVDRLAAILAPELERELAREAEEEMAGGAAAADSDVLDIDDATYELLIAYRSVALRSACDELTRQQLYKELKAAKESAHYGTKDELTGEVAPIKARAEVDSTLARAQYEPAAAATLHAWLAGLASFDSEAAALAPAPGRGSPTDRAAYEALSSSEVRKMKVQDLRDALDVFEQPSDGNRYEMMERLQTYLESLRAAEMVSSSTSVEDLRTRVNDMNLRELRAQLIARGLRASGPRKELESRLYAGLMSESKEYMLEKAEAAAATGGADGEGGAEGGEGEEDEVESPMGTLDLRVVTTDPPLTIALVVGAPGGSLADAADAVTAARAVVAALHTAPLPALVAAAAHLGHSDGDGGHSDGGEGHSDGGTNVEEWRHGARGLTVRVYYLDRAGAGLHALSTQQLLSAPNAAAIEASLSSSLSAPEFSVPLTSGACDVVLPVLCGPPSSGAMAGALARLATAGLPVIGGQSGDAATLSSNGPALTERLRSLGYPTLPTYHVEADAGAEELSKALTNWCTHNSFDADTRHLLVKPARGGRRGQGFAVVCGAESAAAAAAHLVEEMGADACGGALVLPWLGGGSAGPGGGAIEFSCTVVQGPDGPLALLPAEVEIEDVDDALVAAQLDHHAWEMEKDGMAAEDIEVELAELRAGLLPAPEFRTHAQGRTYLPTQTVHYHCPPRMDRKTVHHVRHACAKLFAQLGLKDIARFQGWMVPQEGWRQKYDYVEGEIRLLPDYDFDVVARCAADEASLVPGGDTLPLSGYYDDSELHAADLARFEPSARLDAGSAPSGTLDASVYVCGVHAGPSHTAADYAGGPGSLSVLTAAEVGLSHAGLLRNVVNSALRRAHDDARAAAPPPATTSAPEGAHFAVQLAAGPDVPVYETTLMYTSTPDMWDLLIEMQDAREVVEAFEVEEEVDDDDEYEELAEVAESIDDVWAEHGEALEAAAAAGKLSEVAGALADEEFATGPVLEAGIATGATANPFADVAFGELWDDARAGEDDAAMPEDADASGSVPAASAGILALKARYPDLTDDEVMRLYVGETRTGAALDAQGFVDVCRLGLGASNSLLVELEEREALLEHFDVESPPLPPADGADGAVDEVEEEEVEEGGEGEVDVAAEEALAAEVDAVGLPPVVADASELPRPQRVWVLMGGDVECLDASVASGMEVVRKLSQFSDLQVEPFLLAPAGAGSDERARRTALLARRNEELSHGTPVEELSPEMQLSTLRVMPGASVPLAEEHVWALSPAAAAQSSGDAVLAACERALAVANTCVEALGRLGRQALEARWDTQMELEAGGLVGVGQLWGGAYDAPQPIPPRLLSLTQFAEEAEDTGALVFMATGGGHAATGQLQAFLAAYDVPTTGPSPQAAAAAGERASLPDALAPLEERGVSTPPRLHVYAPYLVDVFDAGLEAAALAMASAREAIFEDPDSDEPLVIRPESGWPGGGDDYVRVGCPEDLLVYCEAVACSHPFVRGGDLSVPHPDVHLPRFTPRGFTFEPYIESDPVWVSALGARGDAAAPIATALQALVSPPAAALSWAGELPWVPVRFGLLGTLGGVKVLGPSLCARLAPDGGPPASPGVPLASEAVELGCVPESIASADAVAAARARAVEVADVLGLSGLSRLDAFMHADTGELIVTDLDLCPDLSGASPLYTQAVHDSNDPLYPHELLRAVVLDALLSEPPSSDDVGDLLGPDEGEDEDDEGEYMAAEEGEELDGDDDDDGDVGVEGEEEEEPDYAGNWK
ncbi:hypothetical protein FOA52_001224 [Chlamydomonas sp. UWO 241]|nr:hypothetical protein FOA52_001224 [Chlamydomonas sp. UWO 241]